MYGGPLPPSPFDPFRTRAIRSDESPQDPPSFEPDPMTSGRPEGSMN